MIYLELDQVLAIACEVLGLEAADGRLDARKGIARVLAAQSHGHYLRSPPRSTGRNAAPACCVRCWS